MDIGTSGPDAPRPNQVLISLRHGKGWGRPRLARELDAICRRNEWTSPGLPALEKQIYRLETGRVSKPDEFYERLYCLAYQMTAAELFGETEVRPSADPARLLGVRSHKFIPAFVGTSAADTLIERFGLTPQDDQWFSCSSGGVESLDGDCTLYVWPFGVAIFHLAERREFSNLAALSVWRKASYQDSMTWADDLLRTEGGLPDAQTSYVLSAYWVERPIWGGLELESALRIMCIPRVLRQRDEFNGTSELEHAELVESSLLRNGFAHPEIQEFGMKGIAHGYASWSGVVYLPVAEARCLSEGELVRCELAVQSAWAYCEHIRSQVEDGRDPTVPEVYGWRFVRALRSRLMTERPQETTQHRSMREALISTSGLTRHLEHTVEILRESGR